MDTLSIAQQYFDAWNRHDPSEILALFAEGGTYTDPSSGGTLTGEAIGHYAGGLFSSFPDLSFDLASLAATDETTVAAQWIMKGTNSAPMMDMPPTNKTIALPGADFISIEGGKVKSVLTISWGSHSLSPLTRSSPSIQNIG